MPLLSSFSLVLCFLFFFETPQALPPSLQAASLVGGQADFTSKIIDAPSGAVNAAGLNFPRAIAISPSRIAVADTLNHRVLFWPVPGAAQSVMGPATAIFGQNGNFSGHVDVTSQSTLSLPYGLAFLGEDLYIADSSSDRVVMVKQGDAVASKVWGQPDFTSSSSNRGAGAGNVLPNGLDGPKGVAVTPAGDVIVSDTINNRVVAFRPGGDAAFYVFGQPSFTTGTANRGQVEPSADSLDQPSHLHFDALFGLLYICDSHNHRILVVDFNALSQTAVRVIGQPSFVSKTIAAGTSGLNFPESMVVDLGGNVAVADYSNDRVISFPADPAMPAIGSRVYGQLDFAGSSGGVAPNRALTDLET